MRELVVIIGRDECLRWTEWGIISEQDASRTRSAMAFAVSEASWMRHILVVWGTEEGQPYHFVYGLPSR